MAAAPTAGPGEDRRAALRTDAPKTLARWVQRISHTRVVWDMSRSDPPVDPAEDAIAMAGVATPVSPAAGTNASDYAAAAYELHRTELYGFLLAATRDGEQAADLLHEVFARLLRHLRRQPAPVDARAWLFRVAANLAISAARRRATVRRWAPWLASRDVGISAEQEALRRHDADQVRSVLATLRPDDRVALLMRAHGCSTSEVAAALGRSEPATRTLLCRARLRLRDRIEAEGGTP